MKLSKTKINEIAIKIAGKKFDKKIEELKNVVAEKLNKYINKNKLCKKDVPEKYQPYLTCYNNFYVKNSSYKTEGGFYIKQHGEYNSLSNRDSNTKEEKELLNAESKKELCCSQKKEFIKKVISEISGYTSSKKLIKDYPQFEQFFKDEVNTLPMASISHEVLEVISYKE